MRRIALLVIITLTLAACGDATDDTSGGEDPAQTTTIGSDDTTTTSAPPPTLTTNPPKDPSPTSPSGDPVGFPEPVFPEGQIDPGLQPFIDAATTDLAARLGVDAGEIETVSATIVVWNDTSLGCPQPDMFYAQVLQDGSLVELRLDGLIYRYHTGGEVFEPFLCNQPLKEPPATGDAP